MPNRYLTLSIWNVWDKSPDDKIIDRLEQMIASYDVEVFGLNEIVATKNGASPVLKMLRDKGYKVHFVPFGRNRDSLYDGSVLASRLPLKSVKVYDLAKGHINPLFGHHDHTFKLISAQTAIGSTDVTLAIIHQPHLAPSNWAPHIKSWRRLNTIIKQPEFSQVVIIGGDTNLSNFLFKRTNIARQFKQLTDNNNSSWRYNGNSNFLKASYDRILYKGSDQTSVMPKELHVLNRQPSDHTPLVAKFELKTNL